MTLLYEEREGPPCPPFVAHHLTPNWSCVNVWLGLLECPWIDRVMAITAESGAPFTAFAKLYAGKCVAIAKGIAWEHVLNCW